MTPDNRTFRPANLLRRLDGRYADVRQELRTVMRRPEFAPVVALPNETRLCAGGLVDAFGIPDELLAAPIGVSDGRSAPD
ncbi:MAG: acyl-CoA dehydrogenase [Solirubrobacteraceae bacterium]